MASRLSVGITTDEKPCRKNLSRFQMPPYHGCSRTGSIRLPPGRIASGPVGTLDDQTAGKHVAGIVVVDQRELADHVMSPNTLLPSEPSPVSCSVFNRRPIDASP